MSAFSLTQSATAVGVNIQASFLAIGGFPPYTYRVQLNGAGGTINSSTGLYTAPSLVNGGSFGPPSQIYDTIQATDSQSNIVTSQILVGNALLLLCEIIQNQMNLPVGNCYVYNQKIFQPTDSGLYIAVAIVSCKPFSNVNTFNGSNSSSYQWVNNYAQVQLDVISRDTEARDRKEEVLMALASTYSQTQQEANSFLIGRLPPGSQFVNLSNVDGSAIPYRFNISVGMQFIVTKTVDIGSIDSFSTPQIVPNP